jgi:hypothetical protein
MLDCSFNLAFLQVVGPMRIFLAAKKQQISQLIWIEAAKIHIYFLVSVFKFYTA